MQRLETVEDTAWETKGILVEWKAVRIADKCAQTLLKIQALTSAIQKLVEGKSNAATHVQHAESMRI